MNKLRNRGRGRLLARLLSLTAAASFLAGCGVAAQSASRVSSDVPVPQQGPLVSDADGPREGRQEVLIPESWTAPQPGWLYMLDPNNLQDEGQILLVDPTNGAVNGAIRTGHAPDMAVTSDGSKLFVVSLQGDHQVLSVVDTKTGQQLSSITVPGRVAYTASPPWSGMVVSRGDRQLHISRTLKDVPGQSEYGIATYDISAGRLLVESASLPNCRFAQLSAGAEDGVVQAACPNLRTVYRVRIGANGAASELFSVKPAESAADQKAANDPRVHNPGIVGSIAFPSTGKLFSAIDDGRLYEWPPNGDVKVRTGSETGVSGVALGALVGDEQGGKLYVGQTAANAAATTTDPPEGRTNRTSLIRVLDAGTLKPVGSIPLSAPVATLAIDRQARLLYGVNPETRQLLVIDLKSLKEVRTVSDVGKSPAYVLPAG